ncbi:MAG: hypothetical protein MJZ37_10570, partial [Bacilli bacterium]|nr:hypothetical protein [Bacilli bacterium]
MPKTEPGAERGSTAPSSPRQTAKMREKPETVDFPNAASQGAKIGSISQPSPTGNPATIGCVYSCTGAFSFALY